MDIHLSEGLLWQETIAATDIQLGTVRWEKSTPDFWKGKASKNEIFSLHPYTHIKDKMMNVLLQKTSARSQ